MRKFIALTLVFIFGLGILATDAQAKRFGGGKSVGKQREQISQPATPKTAAPAAPATAPKRSWLGPLAGLAAGGLLAALFMGGAFDGIKAMDVLMLVLLAAAVFFVLRALRRPAPQATQYAVVDGSNAPSVMAQPMGNSAIAAVSSRPDWFEDEPFLRAAKGHFIRLQDAYDRGDLNDIREYTTPEVFAEISLQIQERGAAKNKTDVVQLDAEIGDVASESGLVIASVRFHGLIREEEGGMAQPFNEIWHIQKSAIDRTAPWYVGGIQQLS